MVADPKAVDYIRTQLNSGFSVDTIEKAMLDAGWKEQQIEEAIDQVMEETQGKEEAMKPRGSIGRAFPGAVPLPQVQQIPPLSPGAPSGPPVPRQQTKPPEIPAPVHGEQKPPGTQSSKQATEAAEGGVSLLSVMGFGLALGGGAAAMSSSTSSAMPGVFASVADIFIPLSFSALVGDPLLAAVLNTVLGAAVFVMAVLMYIMRGFRMVISPLIIGVSLILFLNGFFIGSLMGIAGGALALLGR